MIKPSPTLPKDRTAKKDQAPRAQREAVIAKLVVKTGIRAGRTPGPCMPQH
jgi:hypothetical protein